MGTFPLLTYERKIKIVSNTESKVVNLIKEKIEYLEYELYDVEYVKEGKNFFLRIYIDSPKGITLSDCERVSNEIEGLLDDADFIKEQYFLEVSSPRNRKSFKKQQSFKTKHWQRGWD